MSGVLPLCVLGTQSCPTRCNPVDCSPPGLLCMGFSRQEYWCGLPFPSPGDLPYPGIEPRSPALQANALPYELLGKSLPSFPSFREELIILGSCQQWAHGRQADSRCEDWGTQVCTRCSSRGLWFCPRGCWLSQAALFPPARGVVRAAVSSVSTVSGSDGSGNCPSKPWG